MLSPHDCNLPTKVVGKACIKCNSKPTPFWMIYQVCETMHGDSFGQHGGQVDLSNPSFIKNFGII